MNVRRCIAAAALVAAPLLSSCGVNFDAQTDQPYNPAVGVDSRAGEVDVLNALIVSGSDGSGTVVATLVNNDQAKPDTLKGVSGAGPDSGLQVQLGGDTQVPAGGLLSLAKQGDVSAKGKRVIAGNFVKVTFSFDRAEAVTLDVPVVSSSNPDYKNIKVPSGS